MTSNSFLKGILGDQEISSRMAQARESLRDYDARIGNLWRRSEELRRKFPDPGESEFRKYIDTEGILYYRELQECGVTFPSWSDMVTVGGETDLRLFLKIGRGCFDDIEKYLPQLERQQRVLDFGVGCGRTARHFYQKAGQYEVHGCDVDEAPIGYLYREVPFIQPLVSSNEPPLPYESGYFDSVYCISVFSHLNKSAFYAWLEELARIVRPGGVVIVSIHGEHALGIVKSRGNVGSLGIKEKAFWSAVKLFSEEGFVWMPQKTSSQDIDTSQYGISFIDKNQLKNYVPSSLNAVHYGEGEIGGWQDLVVFEKTS